MAENLEQKLILPGGSWDRIQRIIRAYRAANDEESPTVESIAKLAGMKRPLISMNNRFLRGLGLLQEERNKLTRLGVELATGLEIGSDEMVIGALRRGIADSPTVSQLINILRARGPMKLEAFKGQVMILAGINQDSPSMQWIKSFLDILQDAQVIQMGSDDTVSAVSHSRPLPPSVPPALSTSPEPAIPPSPVVSEGDPKSERNDGTLTIKLKSGGSLTLSVSVNLLKLTTADRAFVFKLIDDLNSYGIEQENHSNLQGDP